MIQARIELTTGIIRAMQPGEDVAAPYPAFGWAAPFVVLDRVAGVVEILAVTKGIEMAERRAIREAFDAACYPHVMQRRRGRLVPCWRARLGGRVGLSNHYRSEQHGRNQ